MIDRENWRRESERIGVIACTVRVGRKMDRKKKQFFFSTKIGIVYQFIRVIWLNKNIKIIMRNNILLSFWCSTRWSICIQSYYLMNYHYVHWQFWFYCCNLDEHILVLWKSQVKYFKCCIDKINSSFLSLQVELSKSFPNEIWACELASRAFVNIFS